MDKPVSLPEISSTPSLPLPTAWHDRRGGKTSFQRRKFNIMTTVTLTLPQRRPNPMLLSAVTAAVLAMAAIPAQGAIALPPAAEPSDFPVHSPEKVELGKNLFYDKLISGNRNMACASCHHALTDLGDGLSLPVGEGGRGLGVARGTGPIPSGPTDTNGIYERVPRNAPQFFNDGAFEFERMFWDGRVAVDTTGTEPSGFITPAGADTPLGLETVLAAQALFPITSPTEMRGQPGENDIADAASIPEIWGIIEARLQAEPNYLPLFQAAYPNGTASPAGPVNVPGDITIDHMANAIGAYEDVALRAINAPFDRFRRGDRRAMSYNQLSGMRLFYGKAGCSACHSGSFQTDHEFHAVAVPQIGAGRGDTAPSGDVNADFGREQVTGDPADRYKFRTPSLRNTALTGPWGHDGAYDTLEAIVRHMADPATGLENYDTAQAVLPSRPDLDALDFEHHSNADNRAAIVAAIDPLIVPVALSDREIGLLIDFLHALTDPASVDIRATLPMTVPSGLPLAD